MASWNPALMPNTATDSGPEPHVSNTPNATIQQDQVSPDAIPGASNDSYARAPLHTAQTGSIPHSPTPLSPDVASTPGDEDSRQAPGDGPAVAASAPPTNFAKHASSVSFARTVSHDVNWLDEEDGDWDLGRSDTDPFNKLMPQNERTNSFPAVPPQPDLQHEPNATTKPLAHSQAEDILNQVDGLEHSHSFEQVDASESDGAQMLAGSHSPAPGSRFEEGLPLVPQQRQRCSSLGGSFADIGAEEEEDFFSQIHDSAAEQKQVSHSVQPLERKSTTQAMGSASVSGPPGQDLAAKWAMEFADDEDFVLDGGKDADPTAFFGGDDEGLLEDTATSLTAPKADNASPKAPTASSRYAPPNSLNVQSSTAPAYTQPSPSWHPQVPPSHEQQPSGATQSPNFGAFTPQPPRPEVSMAQSFVDKSKGGYHSPYDLPMEIVKPRKRATAQHAPRATSSPAAPLPPRSSSIGSQGPPQRKDSASSTSSFGTQQAHTGPAPVLKPTTKHKESFFEELPVAARPRPASRHSQPSPSQASPYGPPQSPVQALPHVGPQSLPHGVPSHSAYVPSPLSSPPKDPNIPPMSNLVAPPRTDPYAPLQSHSQPAMPPSAASSTRYSPAPTQGQGNASSAPPPPARYSPAPPGSKPNGSGYIHSGNSILPHQPRTSSPLAHFESGSGKSVPSSAPPSSDHAPMRSNSSGYAHPSTRIPSLPPTREVDEENEFSPNSTYQPAASGTSSPTESRQPAHFHAVPPQQTPPSSATFQTLSPPKRGAYTPQASSIARDFVPPPRSHTQSPGALYGGRSGSKASEPIPRPSSVSGLAPSRSKSSYTPSTTQAAQPVPPPIAPTRSRGLSQKFDLIAPTDGRETDPLQRWKGCPVFSWGVGGAFVTSFPQPVPRYGGISSSRPSMVMSPGEVKVQSIKEIRPLEDRLSRFPGPLKGKGKKKETVAWLTAGIEGLDKESPQSTLGNYDNHNDKRADERLLLWKILRVFIEHDGILEGSAIVDKAVRDVLVPGLESDASMLPTTYGGMRDPTVLQESAMTRMQADAVDASTIERIRNSLLKGDREAAIWAAVDKRLWGHAMLIARTTPPEIFVKVAHEFVRKEVNYSNHNNESLAALYGVFSGNFEECVDELVPVHARAGLQLMATSPASGPSKDAMEGLDKWRETLSLILGNRSPGDTQALVSLGNLLAGYGRAEASHICYLFARNTAVFGGLDDSNSNFVLVGADHRRQAHQFSSETEALLLSEVYEYGLSLSAGSGMPHTAPHLAAYKLQHALTLAEYGYRDKALQYCEAIFQSISSQTRKSPYHHPVLESAVEDLMKRLRQAPREENNSWIPKPSMTKMSDSLFKKFNNFVSGDDNDESGTGSPTDAAESGPFARVASGTPTISRSPSTSNFESYGNPSTQPLQMPPPAGYPASAPPTRAASRYAPAPTAAGANPSAYQAATAYAPAPRPSTERSSSEYSRAVYEPGGHAPAETASATPYGYAPDGASTIKRAVGAPGTISGPQPPTIQYQPPTTTGGEASRSSSYQPSPSHEPSSPEKASLGGFRSQSYGFEPLSALPSKPDTEPQETSNLTEVPEEEASGGYEPPSYGYEPPTYQPYQAEESDEDDDKPKPKKKTIFDDEEDDIPGLRQQQAGKSKAEKDRENEELVRRAIEEDAKRAEAEKAQKQSGGWMSRMFGFGGGAKKEEGPVPVKAKLGESNSFVFDPELNRWVNKKAGAEQTEAKTATPPPPRGGAPRSVSGTPPPPANGRASAPPPRSFTPQPSALSKSPSKDNLQISAPMMRSASNTSTASLPPRPATSLSNASSIDDLLGAGGPRKPKKPRKSGRYVDVMAKN